MSSHVTCSTLALPLCKTADTAPPTPPPASCALRAIIIMPHINNASQYTNNTRLQHGLAGGVVGVVWMGGRGWVEKQGGLQAILSLLSNIRTLLSLVAFQLSFLCHVLNTHKRTPDFITCVCVCVCVLWESGSTLWLLVCGLMHFF